MGPPLWLFTPQCQIAGYKAEGWCSRAPYWPSEDYKKLHGATICVDLVESTFVSLFSPSDTVRCSHTLLSVPDVVLLCLWKDSVLLYYSF